MMEYDHMTCHLHHMHNDKKRRKTKLHLLNYMYNDKISYVIFFSNMIMSIEQKACNANTINTILMLHSKHFFLYPCNKKQYFTEKNDKILIKTDLICRVKEWVVDLQLFLTCYIPKSEVKL